MRRRTALWVAASVLAAANVAFAQNAAWNGSAAQWGTDNWIWAPTGSGFPNAPTHNAAVNSGIVLIGPGSDFTVGSFSMTGGAVTGAGRLTVNGAFNLSGGQFSTDLLILGTGTFSGGNMISSGATTTVAAGGSLVFALNGNTDTPGRRILNLGTVTRSAGNLRGGGTAGTVYDNQGLWIDAVVPNSVFNNDYGGVVPTFNNAAGAVFRKTTASDVSFNNVTFNNAGLVDVQAGSVSLNSFGSASDGAEFRTASGATLSLNNSHTLSGTVSFTGSGLSRLNAGTLAGTHALAGTLSWTGGTLNSLGTTTLTPNSVLIITVGAADLATRTLVNNGTVNRTFGSVRGGGAPGSFIENNATWNDALPFDSQFNSDYGGAGLTFNNNAGATFTKSTNTGVLFSNARFNNAGTLSVQAGSMTFLGGGQSFAGSTFAATGGTLIRFADYTLAAGTTYSGPGQFSIVQGANTLLGTVDADRFDFAGGTSGGTATFVGSNLTWTAGNLNRGGTFTIAPTGSLTISAAPSDLAGLTLVNTGSVTRTFSSLRGGAAGSVIDNRTIWTDAVAGNSQFNSDYGGAGLVFRNAAGATFRKTAGGTVAFVNAAFTNDGTVDAADGQVQFLSPGSASDGSTFNAASTGTVTFGSNFTLSGTINLTGPGIKRWANGTLLGTHTLNGDFSWSGGNFNSVGTTTIPQAATLLIDLPGNADLATRTLVNNGTIHRTVGNLRGGSTGGSLLENNALFIDNVPVASQFNSDYGGTQFTFNNNPGATFRKTSASLTTVSLLIFNNRSLVDVQAGTVTFSGSSAKGFDGSEFRAAAGTVVNYDDPTFAGTVSFSGSGTHNFYAGFLRGNFTLDGRLRWIGGALSGPTTTRIATTGTLDMLAGQNDLTNHILENFGTVNHIAGVVRGGGNPGSLIRNAGTWNETTTTITEYNSDFGGQFLSIENLAAAQWRFTTPQTVRLRQVSFKNAGLVDLQAGNLDLTGGTFYQQTAGRTQLTGGNITGIANIQFTGGELAGSGSVAVGVEFTGGTLTPGLPPTSPSTNSVGLLSLGGLRLLPASDFVVDILGNSRGTDYDAIDVTAVLELFSPELIVNVASIAPAGSAIGVTYEIARAGQVLGTFANLPEGQRFFAGPLELEISYGRVFPRTVTLTTIQVIPEPSSLAPLLLTTPLLTRRRR